LSIGWAGCVPALILFFFDSALILPRLKIHHFSGFSTLNQRNSIQIEN
jgi:hypothetical protein